MLLSQFEFQMLQVPKIPNTANVSWILFLQLLVDCFPTAPLGYFWRAIKRFPWISSRPSLIIYVLQSQTHLQAYRVEFQLFYERLYFHNNIWKRQLHKSLWINGTGRAWLKLIWMVLSVYFNNGYWLSFFRLSNSKR